ncbi:MAG: hypothetical protein VYD64_02615 [Pseudomonadota bacterium]|nr:hypothetical protein [Pseudomonadota bacterium]
MDDHPAPYGAGIVTGFLVLALRLALVFAVMGAGFFVHESLGVEWFRVYVFAALAAGLHFELRRIDREFPPGADDGD